MAAEHGSQRFQIQVRPETNRLARRTLRMTQRDVGSRYRGQALEMACAHFLSTQSEGTREAEGAASHHSRDFTYHLYPDQQEIVGAALARAKQELNSEDEGEAFHHILVTVRRSYFGSVNFGEPAGLDSAWSGRKGERGADETLATPDPRDRGESPGSDPRPTREAEENCQIHLVFPSIDLLQDMPSAPSVDLRPASAPSRPLEPGGTSKVECDGRQDRPRSTTHDHHDDGGGAQAIFSRGSPCAEHGDPRDRSFPRELGGPLPRFPFDSVASLALAVGRMEDCLRELSDEVVYQPGWVLKPSGEWRRIDEPESILKDAQERLLCRVFDVIAEPSEIAFAVKGRGHIAAARRHERKLWVACCDIDNFFPSVTAAMVHDLLLAMGCGEDRAAVLARLMTYRGALPQGAPTSSMIANLLLTEIDRRVYEYALRLAVTVTRYVDDFAVSGADRDNVKRMLSFIAGELRRLGLREKREKRTLVRRDQPQVVHGLTVNNGVAVPKPYRKALDSDVHRAGQRGCTDKERERLVGRIDYVAKLHPRLAKRLRASLRRAPQAAAQPERQGGRPRANAAASPQGSIRRGGRATGGTRAPGREAHHRLRLVLVRPRRHRGRRLPDRAEGDPESFAPGPFFVAQESVARGAIAREDACAGDPVLHRRGWRRAPRRRMDRRLYSRLG